MNILGEVLKNEVYPALGCTEPVALAYACATAAKYAKIKKFNGFSASISVDPGTYKNGFAVTLPNTSGESGNLLACALGFLIQKPQMKYSIFAAADKNTLKKAKKLALSGKINLSIDYTKKDFFAEVTVKQGNIQVICALSGGHFNITLLSLNDKIIKTAKEKKKELSYREFLKKSSFKDLIEYADNATTKELSHIKKGVEMNLSVSQKGLNFGKTASILNLYYKKDESYLTQAKIKSAAATDARMNGLPMPVMSSGQSGNQGVVATILPWIYGKANNIEEKKILKSIALAHLINGYIKTFLGELSPICGCAVSSGAGAACALAYQETKNCEIIEKAAKNVIADLGGMFCDGAKASCALKVVSACDCAHRSALLALKGWSPSDREGFCGKTFCDTVKNLARLSMVGMSAVDSLIIDAMSSKK